MKKLLFSVLCVLIASFTACGPNEPDDITSQIKNEEARISCSHEELVFLYDGKDTITLTANRDWSATTNVDWIKISPSSGRGNAIVEITCAGGGPEEAKIIFTIGKGSVVLPIKRWFGDPQKAIDLGLPSGLKWASSNVGASSVQDYGDYFAWGEVTTKSDYSWSTYKYCNGTVNSMTKYCIKRDYGIVDNKTTLELADDAAHVNWGDNWRMPTDDEWKELLENCKWSSWKTQDGVCGLRAIGSNGNCIFLPDAGYRYYTYLNDAGWHSYYWSSSLGMYHSSYACGVHTFSARWSREEYERYYGQSVRPVCP